MREGRLEGLEEAFIRFLRIGPTGGQSQQRSKVPNTRRTTGNATRAHDSTLPSRAPAAGRGRGFEGRTHRLRNIAMSLEEGGLEAVGAHQEAKSRWGRWGRLDRSGYEPEQRPRESSQRSATDLTLVACPAQESTGPTDMGCKRRVASETSSGVCGLGRAPNAAILRRRPLLRRSLVCGYRCSACCQTICQHSHTATHGQTLRSA